MLRKKNRDISFKDILLNNNLFRYSIFKKIYLCKLLEFSNKFKHFFEKKKNIFKPIFLDLFSFLLDCRKYFLNAYIFFDKKKMELKKLLLFTQKETLILTRYIILNNEI